MRYGVRSELCLTLQHNRGVREYLQINSVQRKLIMIKYEVDLCHDQSDDRLCLAVAVGLYGHFHDKSNKLHV